VLHVAAEQPSDPFFTDDGDVDGATDFDLRMLSDGGVWDGGRWREMEGDGGRWS
jgi:hypothetical protein